MDSRSWALSARKAFRPCGPISWFKDEKGDLSQVTQLTTEKSGAQFRSSDSQTNNILSSVQNPLK